MLPPLQVACSSGTRANALFSHCEKPPQGILMTTYQAPQTLNSNHLPHSSPKPGSFTKLPRTFVYNATRVTVWNLKVDLGLEKDPHPPPRHTPAEILSFFPRRLPEKDRFTQPERPAFKRRRTSNPLRTLFHNEPYLLPLPMISKTTSPLPTTKTTMSSLQPPYELRPNRMHTATNFKHSKSIPAPQTPI